MHVDRKMYVYVYDQAPGQYRPIHARRAQLLGHVLITIFPECAIITRPARLGYQHFFHFLFLYSGSKTRPYRVLLDRLSGQYREIWTGLGCRGLASCMTTVTCRVINWYTCERGFVMMIDYLGQ